MNYLLWSVFSCFHCCFEDNLPRDDFRSNLFHEVEKVEKKLKEINLIWTDNLSWMETIYEIKKKKNTFHVE